ncbi:Uncharacterised protein [Vibrio cholerae]|nr:Uncharacterised protein [Vibrio cholerae]CSC47166.1 Uncharacterised protein [Vibrio cholerae]CSI18939.1 Uncharacterised protein [Vibrio cholerae]
MDSRHSAWLCGQYRVAFAAQSSIIHITCLIEAATRVKWFQRNHLSTFDSLSVAG